MKNQIATTIEQSQRLIACGVDKNTADFYWCDFIPDEPFLAMGEIPRNNDTGEVMSDGDVPAWSLSALIALLPTEIKENNSYFDEISTYGLLIYPYMQGWQIDYQYCEDDECHCLKCIHDTELIEVCVKAVEWLLKNGYNLNKP